MTSITKYSELEMWANIWKMVRDTLV